MLKPFVKYLGGKRGALQVLRSLYPKTYNKYFETFVGGGAVLWDLKPKKALINDIQTDLVDTYKTIRDDLPGLLGLLREHHRRNYETNQSDPGAYYYSVRAWDRVAGYESRPEVERAARFIYMNRVGFNGLIRQNKKGQSNVPWGKGLEKYEVDESNLIDCSSYLKNNEIEIMCQDGINPVDRAEEGDLVMCDPPYLPINETSNFTAYNKGGFSYQDHMRLAQAIHKATDRGAYVIYFGSGAQATFDLFPGTKYTHHNINMKRSINSKADGRGKIPEVIILNYTP